MVKKTGKQLIASAAFVLAMCLAGCNSAGGGSTSTASTSVEPTSQSTTSTSQPCSVHTYGAPTWDWTNLTSSKVYATFTCSVCGATSKKTATLDGSEKQEATCTEKGYVNWKASVSFQSQTYNDSKRVETAAKGHAGTFVEAVPATCTAAGTLAHYHCNGCNKNFSDEACTNEMASIVDPKKDHTLTEVAVKAATCYEDGVSIHHYHCSVCNKNFEDAQGQTEITGSVTTPKTNHAGTCDKTPALEATCYQAGNIDYWHCTACGDYWNNEDLAAAHKISQAQTVVAATAHKGTTTHVERVEATCTTAGNIEYWHCSKCDGYFNDSDLAETHKIPQAETVISATGHNASKVDATIASCTEAGTVEHYHCSKCNKNYSDAECEHELDSIIDPTEPAIGSHSYQANGYSCDCCGADNLYLRSGYIQKTGTEDTTHGTPKGFTKAYTTTDNVGGNTAKPGTTLFDYDAKVDGYIALDIAVFIPGDKYIVNRPSCDTWAQNLIDSRDSENGEWVTIHAERADTSALVWDITANYSSDGAEATWLNTSAQEIGKTITVTTNGNAVFQVICPFTYCTDTTLTHSEILAWHDCCHGDHDYGDPIAAKAATCTDEGYSIDHYVCSKCGRYFDENKKAVHKSDVIISALGHTYEDSLCTRCGKTNLLKVSGTIRDTSKLASSTAIDSPTGFAEVYEYSDAVGGGESKTAESGNSFFNQDGSCIGYTVLDFAVYVKSSHYYLTVYPQVSGSGKNAKVLKSNNTAPTDCWYYIHAERTNPADATSWTLTASLEDGTGLQFFVHDGSAYPSTGVDSLTTVGNIYNTLNGVFKFGLNGAFYVTEVSACYVNAGHTHTLDESGVCTICNMKPLDYSDTTNNLVSNPDNFTETTYEYSPEGFEHVYKYTGLCKDVTNQEETQRFFKQASNNPYTTLKFAILVPANSKIYLGGNYDVDSSYARNRIVIPSNSVNPQWVTITIYKDAETDKWYITNNVGNFTGYGCTVSAQTIECTSEYPSYLTNMCQIDTYTNNIASFYITEIVAS